MARRFSASVGSTLLLGAVLSSVALPVAFAKDQRPTGPVPEPQTKPQAQTKPQTPCPKRPDPDCPPPPCPAPCPLEEPGRSYEITILSVDADRAAVPAVSTFLAGTSNPKEQLAGIRAQAKRGSPILQVSCGPTLNVRQNATGTHDADSARSRITVHPHLNADCAEAFDFLVEQAPQRPSQTGIGTRVSLVFENGDTRLLTETVRPDGSRHLIYATVFFPPRSVPCTR